MLDQFKNARRSNELSERAVETVENLAQEALLQEAIGKVKALFMDSFTKNVNALAEQKVLNLLFSNMFQIDFVWTKYHFVDVEYDAEKKHYKVWINFSKVFLDNAPHFQQKIMTEKQLFSLAKAYDLGLHLGARISFAGPERAEKKYLIFNSPEDLAKAMHALDSWTELKCYRKSNYPNCMEIHSEVQKLLEECDGQIQKEEKLSPRK